MYGTHKLQWSLLQRTLPPEDNLCIKDTGYGTDWHYSSTYNSDSNLPPEDSLPIKDKSHAPKVSFIRRLYCIPYEPQYMTITISITYWLQLNDTMQHLWAYVRMHA